MSPDHIFIKFWLPTGPLEGGPRTHFFKFFSALGRLGAQVPPGASQEPPEPPQTSIFTSFFELCGQIFVIF